MQVAITYTPFVGDDDRAYTASGKKCTQITLKFAEVGVAIYVLNLVLVATALFVLLLYLVVRVPVNYQTYIEKDLPGPYQALNAALYTALDPVTMYYFFYLIIAVVGMQYHAALTFLLLDFVAKSS
ncbi:hypothetical protein B484DRAFT_396044 [Ochromonadaceae sp. CCMP2298]|nr:hypothetical protein B484DRAFT_396044 [Ochromonadaceae sp. CCMP2298]